jgi:tetratricopeptide (TPR) repeat protein
MEEAVSRIRYALREAEHLGGTTTGLRYQLGETLRLAGHPVEAVEILWEVMRDEEEAEISPADRGETAFELALGFLDCKKYGNAVSMFEKAANLYEEGERPALAADMLRRRGNMFRDFDMPDEALESLTKAWELAEPLEADYAIRVNVLEALAMVKGQREDSTAVDDMDKTLTILQSDPTGPYIWREADLIDTKARVLGDLKREEEAVATFLLAGDKYTEAGDLAASARAEHFAAQVLTKGLDRPADAVPLWKSALEHVDAAIAAGADSANLRQSIVLQWGDALEGLGRTSEAAQVRALLD